MLLLGLHSVGRICHIAFSDRIGEDALLFLGIVHSKGGLEIEALERIEIQIYVAEGPPIGITVVGIALQPCHRIFPVGIASHRTCIFPVHSIDRKRWIGLKHILEESARGLHFGGAVDSEMFSNFEDFAYEIVF